MNDYMDLHIILKKVDNFMGNFMGLHIISRKIATLYTTAKK